MGKIGFIGAGTVGTALAVRLSLKGYSVVAVASRTQASAQRLASMVPGCRVYDSGQLVIDTADLIFITTPDDAIAPVVAQLQWQPGKTAVHCSGAASLDILQPAREAGAGVGAFHPLQTFASIAQAVENLPGSTFALEGEGLALEALQAMAAALEGKSVVLKAGDKVLYHAAAVMACNYFVTLVKLATDLWQEFGVGPGEATPALLPLIQGTVNNLKQVGLPHCLTGPIARGDLGTLRKHLSALEALEQGQEAKSREGPSLLSTYRELGLQTIPVSLAKGKIIAQRAEEMKALFESQEKALPFPGNLGSG